MWEEQFGVKEKLPFVFAESEKNDIFAMSPEITRLDLASVRMNNAGMYIGQVRHEEFRPSIEGSELLGKKSTKNILEVNKKIGKMWLYGLDIPCDEELYGWVIVKSEQDWMGSGRAKEGKVMNHVPKGRRIHE